MVPVFSAFKLEILLEYFLYWNIWVRLIRFNYFLYVVDYFLISLKKEVWLSFELQQILPELFMPTTCIAVEYRLSNSK